MQGSAELVEFVPNISEGRDQKTISDIADSVRACAGVRLLNISSDYDHNRTVFTIVGNLESMPECARALYETVIARIDLREHVGIHPRIGAVDVAPFIPLGETTMHDCVELSRHIGAGIADRFDLPVYLYAEAASKPAHKRLANIRRGGFEGLAAKTTKAEWKPDFGPSVPHPTAGATVIGARFFLVAYNIVLDTTEIAIAGQIATRVRESSGGLPGVQAIGLYLTQRGLAQVSLNLLDYRLTSMADIYKAVDEASSDLGANIVDSEIIGMIPKDALGGASPGDLKIANFDERLVLENAFKKFPEKGRFDLRQS